MRPQTDVRTGPTKMLAEWLNANWDKLTTLTNAEVAKKLGYRADNTVSMWKTGKTKVALERLFEIADLLNVEVETLFPMYMEQDLGDKPELWKRMTGIFQRMATKGEADVLQAIRAAMSGARLTAMSKSQIAAMAMIAKDPKLAERLTAKEAA